MKKIRMLTSVVLTGGLGLTGVVTASANAATPHSAHGKPAAGHGKAKGHGTGTVFVCEVSGKGHGPVSGKGHGPVSGKGHGPVIGKGHGPVIKLPSGHGSKGATGKVLIKVLGGKVWVNGKPATGKPPVPPKGGVICFQLPPLPVPGEGGQLCWTGKPGEKQHGKPGGVVSRTPLKNAMTVRGVQRMVGTPAQEDGPSFVKCDQLPPLPAPGKGRNYGCVIVQSTTSAHGKQTTTETKVVQGRVHVNGKLQPKGKPGAECAKLPPLPAPGQPGVFTESGSSTSSLVTSGARG